MKKRVTFWIYCFKKFSSSTSSSYSLSSSFSSSSFSSSSSSSLSCSSSSFSSWSCSSFDDVNIDDYDELLNYDYDNLMYWTSCGKFENYPQAPTFHWFYMSDHVIVQCFSFIFAVDVQLEHFIVVLPRSLTLGWLFAFMGLLPSLNKKAQSCCMYVVNVFFYWKPWGRLTLCTGENNFQMWWDAASRFPHPR